MLRVRFFGKQLYLWGEIFQDLRASFLYKNERFEIDQFSVEKGSSEIKGNYWFDIKKDKHKYNFSIVKLKLHEIEGFSSYNPEMSSDISLRGEGSFGHQEDKGGVDFYIENTSIGGKDIPNSHGKILIKDGVFDMIFYFLNDDIVLKSKYFLGSKKRKSTVSINIDTMKIKEISSIFFPHNINKSDIFGRITAELRANFSFDRLNDLDLLIDIKEFSYRSRGVELDRVEGKHTLSIESGKVKDQNLLFTGLGSNIELSLSQLRGEGVDLDVRGEISASIIEMISRDIVAATGSLFFRMGVSVFSEIKNYVEASLEGRDINLIHSRIPSRFEDLNFVTMLKSNKVSIEKFSGKLGGGSVEMEGSALLKFPFPVLDIKYNLNNSEMRFFNKTNIWISSSGRVFGEDLPYVIENNIILINGRSFDGFEKFKWKKKKEYKNPYLPFSENERDFSLFRINSNLVTSRPIRIKNEISDISIHGKFRFFGKLSSPKIDGEVRFVPKKSKFYFRNSNFAIERGRIVFDQEGVGNPLINLVGISSIQEYQVKLEVFGRQDSIEIELTSRPELEEGEILSLLATGVVSSQDSGDSIEQRNSATLLGLLIFDQFRINRELNSALGVNLSLDSKIIEEEKSYFSNELEGGSRQSTKLSVNKKITDKIFLKASSTLGGDISQERSFNINYDINKNLILEGVYELKDIDNEQGDLSDSIGADIKFRIEF